MVDCPLSGLSSEIKGIDCVVFIDIRKKSQRFDEYESIINRRIDRCCRGLIFFYCVEEICCDDDDH